MMTGYIYRLSVQVVLLLDVDFLPSTTILSDFHSWAGFRKMMDLLADKKALVLPAFEPSNKEGGEALVKRVVRGELGTSGTAFHVAHMVLSVISRAVRFLMYWPHEGGKRQVAKAIHDLEMRPFAFTEHIGGQGYTNHSRWLASSLPYELPFIQQLV